jgi:hypothetical protein
MCLTFIGVKAVGTPSLTTMPFSMPDRGMNSVVTAGAASGVEVGYARMSSGPEAAAAGLAIFGYRQSGVLISEAGVPASPPITQGRIAAETGPSTRTGLAIANPNPNPATLSFYFTDADGREVLTGTAFIPAGGQIAEFLNETRFGGPAVFTGSFSFTSNVPVAVTALRGTTNERSEFLLTTLPVTDLSAPPVSGPALFPHFADGGGWTTRIMLVNPSAVTISGTMEFRSALGQPLSAINYSIPPRSGRPFVTNGVGEAVNAGSVLITPAAGSVTPGGSLVFSFTRGGVRVTEAGVSLSAASTAFRLYAEASEQGSIQPGVAIANPSADNVTVTLDLIDANGATVRSGRLTIGPNAQTAAFLSQIPGFEMLRLPFKGLLRISSGTPIAAAGLRGRYNERGDFLIAATPPVPEGGASGSAELVFPHFADAGGYTTQFILFGRGAGPPVSGALRFFSQNGQSMGLKLK